MTPSKFSALVLCLFFVFTSCQILSVNTLTINQGDISLEPGGTVQLTVTITPDNAGDKSVVWNSENEKAAAVDDTGLVTAIAEGSSLITAEAADGSGKSDSITVTVTPPTVNPPSPLTAGEIFEQYKGKKIITNGWADIANSGDGLSYTNPADSILIDDTAYPDPKAKRKKFTDEVSKDTAKFIIISGDIDLGDGVITDADKTYFDEFDPETNKRLHNDISYNIGSNTTIIGINNARFMFGGLRISNKSNVIIRNITFYDAHGSTEYDTNSPGNSESKASIDALVVQGTSNGIWVDHCKFTDGQCNDLSRNYNHDGAFDIPEGVNITVSWCEFTNHDKVMLVAGNDTLTNVKERQITLHHNYFHGTTQRMPRTRGTEMHIYNNYYNNIGNSANGGHFMGPGLNAYFIVENNFFGTKAGSRNIEWSDNTQFPAKVYYAGNNKDNLTFWTRASVDKAWTPAYEYTLEANDGLPESVPANAGPLLNFTD